MFTLINGSPKLHHSNSLYFLNIVGSNLSEHKLYELKRDKHEDIVESIKQSSVMILAFPLYVDSPTSLTLDFLDYVIDKNIKLENKVVYVIINCGFREGEQNITALNIIKRWCEKVDAIYSGSILIGAGEIVGKEKYKFISRKALKKLKTFSTNIILKKKNKDIVTTIDLLNNNMYCYIANLFWTKKGKLNKLTKDDLLIK